MFFNKGIFDIFNINTINIFVWNGLAVCLWKASATSVTSQLMKYFIHKIIIINPTRIIYLDENITKMIVMFYIIIYFAENLIWLRELQKHCIQTDQWSKNSPNRDYGWFWTFCELILQSEPFQLFKLFDQIKSAQEGIFIDNFGEIER